MTFGCKLKIAVCAVVNMVCLKVLLIKQSTTLNLTKLMKHKQYIYYIELLNCYIISFKQFIFQNFVPLKKFCVTVHARALHVALLTCNFDV